MVYQNKKQNIMNSINSQLIYQNSLVHSDWTALDQLREGMNSGRSVVATALDRQGSYGGQV